MQLHCLSTRQSLVACEMLHSGITSFFEVCWFVLSCCSVACTQLALAGDPAAFNRRTLLAVGQQWLANLAMHNLFNSSQTKAIQWASCILSVS
jgi:hypothetical protein